MLLGIKDMRCKVRGPTTPLSLIRAAFQGLLSQVKQQGTGEVTLTHLKSPKTVH